MTELVKWSLIVVCALCFVICDYLAASWAANNHPGFLTLMIALSPFGYLIFSVLNQNESLSVSTGLVSCVIIISTVCVGVLFFGDQLTPIQIFGVICAIVAVVAMSV